MATSRERDRFKLLSLAAMSMALFEPHNYVYERESKHRGESIEERNKRKGLREFDIDGKKVWALNHKNAIKKLNNR